jgi:hypothetical protein
MLDPTGNLSHELGPDRFGEVANISNGHDERPLPADHTILVVVVQVLNIPVAGWALQQNGRPLIVMPCATASSRASVTIRPVLFGPSPEMTLHHPAPFEERRGLLNLSVRDSARACDGSDHCATDNGTYDSADRASHDRSGDRSGDGTCRSTPLIR